MPDDEGKSDDLFEDLDKFFAPIKDVEWDEPEEGASAGEAPGEEHVTVRGEPEPVVTVPASSDGATRRRRRPSRTTRTTTRAIGTTPPRSSPSTRRSEARAPR